MSQSKLFYWLWCLITKSKAFSHSPYLLSPLSHSELNLSWGHRQTGQEPWGGSMWLQSIAAFLLRSGSLHTPIPTLLELTQTTTGVRKCCSTSTDQGSRTPGRLTDRWDAETPNFLRLNKTIRNQYLQRWFFRPYHSKLTKETEV